ncbi:MAG: hypothetical protein ACJA0E_000914 [Bermanella sp.]|jgi:hypothetical protein
MLFHSTYLNQRIKIMAWWSNHIGDAAMALIIDDTLDDIAKSVIASQMTGAKFFSFDLKYLNRLSNSGAAHRPQ